MLRRAWMVLRVPAAASAQGARGVAPGRPLAASARSAGAAGVGLPAKKRWAPERRESFTSTARAAPSAAERGAEADGSSAGRGSGAARARGPASALRDLPVEVVRGRPVPPALHPELEVALPTRCYGCGVKLQRADPDAPGFFVVPRKLLERYGHVEPAPHPGSNKLRQVGGRPEGDAEAEAAWEIGDEASPSRAEDAGKDGATPAPGRVPPGWLSVSVPADADVGLEALEGVAEASDDGEPQAPSRTQVGRRVSVESYPESDPSTSGRATEADHIRCARCRSLAHGGKVKSERAELALPHFDFARVVGNRVHNARYRRQVVVAVVDVADFAGSFPEEALRSIVDVDLRGEREERERDDTLWGGESSDEEGGGDGAGEQEGGAERRERPRSDRGRDGGAPLDEDGATDALVPEDGAAFPSSRRKWNAPLTERTPRAFELVVALTKADLLPGGTGELGVREWARREMARRGLPRADGVRLVSASTRRGVRELLGELQRRVGSRGDVWMVGAQNAGKSSLVNALRAVGGLRREGDVTAAHLAGTTLGLLRVPGLLRPPGRFWDTPGVERDAGVAAWLAPEEARALQPTRALKPRSWRLGAGQTVTLGGVAQVEVVACEPTTLYLTAWVSPSVRGHLGSAARAKDLLRRHLGGLLTPPSGPDGWPDLVPTELEVEGSNWERAGADVSVAGLGWVGVTLKGRAKLRVWAPPGVAVGARAPLLRDRARKLERPGFGEALGRPMNVVMKGGL